MTEATPPHPTDAGDAPLLPRLAALVVAVLGFLPVANWIGGGHQAEWYASVASEWVNGSLIAIGGGIVLTILSRRLPLWRAGLAAPLVRRAHAHPGITGGLLAALAFALYATVAWRVLSAKPLLIDEISQLFQARTFARGMLWRDASAYPEFTSVLLILDGVGKWFSQFPPGGPLMLVPGVWAGAPWLVGPAAGAASVALFWGVVRRAEQHTAVALGAAMLFAAAPFVAFMAGSHMNHVTALFWIMVAVYALTRMGGADEPRPLFAALAGFALGATASIRPVDAIAFAIPAALWMLTRAVKHPPCWSEVAAAGAALAVPVAGILWYNGQTTGHPLLFAYEQLWGKEHGLGFHRVPWGVAHTPARGAELLNLYFLRLQSYLFESAVPSLATAIAALALSRRLTRVDRYLLASGGALVALYFAYWHDGFYLGPRFMYLLAPVLVWWTARFPALVRARWPRAEVLHRGVWYTMLMATAVGITVNIPLRAARYAGELSSMRADYTGEAARAGVEHALILVRESWGAQLVVRMWALGVPHSQVEAFYRGVDACQLEQAVSAMERDGTRGESAAARLRPLLRDSLHVVRSELSPDYTERVLPGFPYAPLCVARIADDRAGTTILAPVLAQPWGTNVYARDLHARDSLLLSAYPDRPVFLMRPHGSEAGAPLRLERLDVDSLRAAWRSAAAVPVEESLGRR